MWCIFTTPAMRRCRETKKSRPSLKMCAASVCRTSITVVGSHYHYHSSFSIATIIKLQPLREKQLAPPQYFTSVGFCGENRYELCKFKSVLSWTNGLWVKTGSHKSLMVSLSVEIPFLHFSITYLSALCKDLSHSNTCKGKKKWVLVKI